jgi:hypothetical protein
MFYPLYPSIKGAIIRPDIQKLEAIAPWKILASDLAVCLSDGTIFIIEIRTLSGAVPVCSTTFDECQ